MPVCLSAHFLHPFWPDNLSGSVHGREMSAAYGHMISQSAGGVDAIGKVNANLLMSHPSLTVSRKFYLPY